MREAQELHCHACDKYVQFPMDLSLDGNHILTCPNCGHEHCRVIHDGKITGDRWSSRDQKVEVDKRRVWKHNVLPMQTSTASAFIRDKWLNHGLR